MRVLMIHNEYARPSGEEDAVRAISRLLGEHGHQVSSFTRSSAEIAGPWGRAAAFFSGMYSRRSRAEMEALLAQRRSTWFRYRTFIRSSRPRCWSRYGGADCRW